MPVYVRKNLRYDELAQTIAENINKLCPSRIAPKKEIAKQCGVSPSLVTKWTCKKPVMPSTDCLLVIADFFGVDLNWLITKHGSTRELPDYTKTYSGAFAALVSLYDRKIIDPKEIKDPILHYLLNKYAKLQRSNVNADEFDDWVDMIGQQFNIPIAEYHNDVAIQEEILRVESNIVAINEELQYRNLAKALNDPMIVERARRKVYGNKKRK